MQVKSDHCEAERRLSPAEAISKLERAGVSSWFVFATPRPITRQPLLPRLSPVFQGAARACLRSLGRSHSADRTSPFVCKKVRAAFFFGFDTCFFFFFLLFFFFFFAQAPGARAPDRAHDQRWHRGGHERTRPQRDLAKSWPAVGRLRLRRNERAASGTGPSIPFAFSLFRT